eukprot:3404621-Rhodomonas_salina.2
MFTHTPAVHTCSTSYDAASDVTFPNAPRDARSDTDSDSTPLQCRLRHQLRCAHPPPATPAPMLTPDIAFTDAPASRLLSNSW